MRVSTFLILLSLLPALGCTTRLGDLTIVTSKNPKQSFEIVRQGVEGKDCTVQVLGIPFGELNPTIEGAMHDALSAVPDADALANVQVRRTVVLTLLVNQFCFRVRGDAIKSS